MRPPFSPKTIFGTTLCTWFSLLILFQSGAYGEPPAADFRSCEAILEQNLVGPSEHDLGLQRIQGAATWGPALYLQAKGQTRAIESIEVLTLAQYNVLNLMEKRGKFERDPETGDFIPDQNTGQYRLSRPKTDKPRDQLERVGQNITRAQPDILALQEVETLTALEYMTALFLGDRFQPFLINGNDPRGIDIAGLILEDLPFDVEVRSFKNVLHPDANRSLFSRDVVVSLYRPKGAPRNSRPLFISMGVHFKSQRDSQRDPRSVGLRTRQVEATVRISQYFERLYPEMPIFLMGDFNADVRTAPEFSSLWRAGWVDGFNLAAAEHSVRTAERDTHAYFPSDGQAIYNQLDAICGNSVVQRLGLIRLMKIIRDQDAAGNPLPRARNESERDLQGSDHSLVKAEIDFRNLYQHYLRMRAR